MSLGRATRKRRFVCSKLRNDVPHAEPCVCVVEDTSVLYASQLVMRRSELKSNVEQDMLTLHVVATEIGPGR